MVISIVVVFLGCSGGERVDKHDAPDRWPFIVESGYLECFNHNEVVFRHGNDRYALSKAAIKSGKYLSIESMRRRNPPPSNTKMSLKEMIGLGKSGCQ